MQERHPCLSPADTHNPRFKMHNCESATAEMTICGLPTTEVDRVHGYTSLCQVCWPLDGPPQEEPWTENSGREGDVIPARL
jgi:hypothetical protein